MSQPESTDLNDWHRFMAIEANNLAWTLSTKTRSKEEDLTMLDAAHSAAFHWKKLGADIHNARAEMLLAEVHGLLGYGDTALSYAKSVDRFFADKTIDTWERAFVFIILARAYKALDNASLFRQNLTLAQETIAQIENAGDREIVEASMPTLLA